MFKGVRADVRYLDPKRSFGHQSYTSAYLMRLEDEGRFAVPDAETMREQEVIFNALLQEMLAFLHEQANRKVRPPEYEEDPFERARQR